MELNRANSPTLAQGGAQPPRLLFDAPSRRTRAVVISTNGLFCRVPNWGREGAAIDARGGFAPTLSGIAPATYRH